MTRLMAEPSARDREAIDRICGVPRHLATWATGNTPKDGWRMGPGCAVSPKVAEELMTALATIREEGRERCLEMALMIADALVKLDTAMKDLESREPSDG
jgi:hypothetical protein